MQAEQLLQRAKELARTEFAGRTDKAGVDYFTGHLSSVASLVSSDEEKIVAYLHDILEDTDYPEENLREEFGDEIVDAVVLLTHKEKMDEAGYLDYIRNLKASGNTLAIAVKIADLTNNSDYTRLGVSSPDELQEKDRRRWEKYQKSLEILRSKEIYLAGGCFWGMQRFIDQFPGVIETEVGYANGPDTKPDYESVCNNSGHAETVRVLYDEATITLETLLDYYFLVIDPVSINRQGNDIGIQYRTGIYYTEPGQLPVIESVCSREKDNVGKPLAVEVEPLKNFYSAEEYHQKYLEKNPGGYCHIPAKYFTLIETAI